MAWSSVARLSVPSLSLLKYGLPFLAGVAVTALFHGYVMRGEHLEQQVAQTEQAKERIVYITREVEKNNDNSAQYLAELDKARQEADALRADLDAGRVKLRVCRADATVAGMRSDNASALADQAKSDHAELERAVAAILEHAARNDAWMQSAYEVLNRQRNTE